MAIQLSSIKTGGNKSKPLMILHGTPGVGKTYLAAHSENPVFICAEDGLGKLKDTVPAFDPYPENYGQVLDMIGALYQENDFSTVVIDSASALELMIWEQVASDNGKTNVEQIGYGKGYAEAVNYWSEFVKALKGLTKMDKTVILIAHTAIETYTPPESDPYDRYMLKLHKRAHALLVESADVIGFMQQKTHLIDVESSFGNKKRGVTTKSKMMLFTEKASHIAKNRYSLPDLECSDVSDFWVNFKSHTA